MEIPDIIVVNKAEHPLTDTMIREIKGVWLWARTGSGRCRSSAPRRCGGRGVARAGREAHRAPRLSSRPRHPLRAPPAQPAQRGAGHRHLSGCDATLRSRSARTRGPCSAGPGGFPRAGPRQRGGDDPRARPPGQKLTAAPRTEALHRAFHLQNVENLHRQLAFSTKGSAEVSNVENLGRRFGFSTKCRVSPAPARPGGAPAPGPPSPLASAQDGAPAPGPAPPTAPGSRTAHPRRTG